MLYCRWMSSFSPPSHAVDIADRVLDGQVQGLSRAGADQAQTVVLFLLRAACVPNALCTYRIPNRRQRYRTRQKMSRCRVASEGSYLLLSLLESHQPNLAQMCGSDPRKDGATGRRRRVGEAKMDRLMPDLDIHGNSRGGPLLLVPSGRPFVGLLSLLRRRGGYGWFVVADW